MASEFASGLPIIIAIASCLISLWALRIARENTTAVQRQADAAGHANLHAQQIGQSQAIIHFTSRFFDLMKQGEQFGSHEWSYQFWSLHSTEFYFFHNGWLPGFMYKLWMVELASAYCDNPQVWASHESYLKRYYSMYREMYEFFQEIYRIASQNSSNTTVRNEAIEKHFTEKYGKHDIVVAP